jgi:hypothetical protein
LNGVQALCLQQLYMESAILWLRRFYAEKDQIFEKEQTQVERWQESYEEGEQGSGKEGCGA